MKILIVDDDQVSRMKLSAILQPYGQTEEAESGKQAYEMVEEGYNINSPFDLCTLDIEMPGWDGQMTLKKIRELETTLGIQKDNRLSILMITIKGDQRNIMDAFFSGSKWYVQKPVTPEKVKSALEKMNIIK